MDRHWDVIIVGARCAGATLATLLARAGARTLLLEAQPRGTDMPMSTHFVQAAGMEVLDRVGVGAQVRAVTPATRRLRLALDDAEMLFDFPQGREGYCIGRGVLDPMLQDAAEAAGADLRDRHHVVSLLRHQEQVCGVVARTPRGMAKFAANLVVGADGPNSSVAKLTQVEEYLVTDSTRGGYWTYYPASDTAQPPWDGTNEQTGSDARMAFRANGGRWMLGLLTTTEKARTFGQNHRRLLHEALLESDAMRPLVEGKEPVGKGGGALKAKFFYRRPVGPGFALIGDAGHVTDPVTAQGMSTAFLDAERLVTAILDGRPEAFELFWRTRDVTTLPIHFEAIRQGRVGYNEPFMRYVLSRMAGEPELLARMIGRLDRREDTEDVIPPGKLLAWVGSALLRGRFNVLPGFMRAGKVASHERKEKAARMELLRKAQEQLSAHVHDPQGCS